MILNFFIIIIINLTFFVCENLLNMLIYFSRATAIFQLSKITLSLKSVYKCKSHKCPLLACL